MGDLIKKNSASKDGSIQKLNDDISQLEEKISRIGEEINNYENSIRLKLNSLIFRLTVLNEKMKEKQKLKKAKRLEQKKRGKNYKEPVQLIPSKPGYKSVQEVNAGEGQELKRLYKEAVVQVHPDKLGPGGEEDAIKTATDLTAQLNGIYKNGDLEALLNFYQNIVLAHPTFENRTIDLPSVDPKIRMAALLSKKENLAKQLQKLESNYLYHVLQTYENPLIFIDELEFQFKEKIGKLEKRTRKF
ncbi:hypothetical protein M3O96_09470 [Aquiflexum sp. TKW24L]|uniref:J domain-containing protein n=1 Tax=Aquiflexum sp. TKW24L TaxID=2942212 RepID=UPI0020BF28E4|nr:hypothetical protein [Aquiflexum sp. TKW24L]MCL6259316.1 hypothetical protein [Aquiflexum sp. TKW24L]